MGQKVSSPVVTQRAMDFSKRRVFHNDSAPELSTDASMLQPNLTLSETNIGSYINTDWDSLSNLVGVTAGCCLASPSRKRT